jgi:hypothetical protein
VWGNPHYRPRGLRPSFECMKRSSVIALVFALTALVAAAALASPAAKVRKAFLYKVNLNVTAHVEVDGDATGADIDHKENSSHSKATWTIHPQQAEIWLVTYDGVLTNHVTDASGSDHSSGGTITANETFTWFKHTDPLHGLQGTSDCKGTVESNVDARYKAEATAGGTSFDVDFVGGFHPAGSGGLTCDNTPDERAMNGQPTGPSVWEFKWDPSKPETGSNQRMKMGANIQNFEVGLPSISPVLTDYSLVQHAAICEPLGFTTCTVKFKLEGDAELTRVCGATIVGDEAPSCSGGGGGGGGTKKPPPVDTHNPPTLTNLSVTPHSFSLSQGALVKYRLDQSGTQTLVKVSKPLHIAAINQTVDVPVAIFTHVNKGLVVSMALPKSFAGRALAPGHYTLEATPLSTRTGNGTPVKTTFVITG